VKRIATIAAALAMASLGCSDQGPDRARPAGTAGEADRRLDPGYRETRRDLPEIEFRGGRWRAVADPQAGLRALVGARVVVTGRMLLDEPAPYRQRFTLVGPFSGCVDAYHDRHAHDAILVVLPEGETVQVTDEDLRVEGTLAAHPGPGGGPGLRLDATAVEAMGERRPPGGPEHEHR
jgi:hypothetical protein